jgi:nicotinamidase-related amidase
MDTQEGKNLPVPHCIKGTDGWTLDNEVAEALGDEYTPIGKLTFGSVELPQRIKAAVNTDEIEEIQLIGVCTDICVISNAMILKAEFTEVPIRVFADCCAGVTPESHSNALNAMKMCQIIVEE